MDIRLHHTFNAAAGHMSPHRCMNNTLKDFLTWNGHRFIEGMVDMDVAIANDRPWGGVADQWKGT